MHQEVIVDGGKGGLVLGPRHGQGYIYLILEINPGIWKVVGNMEGGEFLLNNPTILRYGSRLNEINSWTGDYNEISETQIASLKYVIDARSDGTIIALSSRLQQIINRQATSRFLEELDEMNYQSLVGHFDISLL